MGYRSDVRIIMSKNGYKEFQKYVKQHIKDYKKNNIEGSVTSMYNYDFNILHNLDVSKQNIDDHNKICIGWNNVKWYKNYEEVAAIMDSLKKLEKNNFGYSYSRIGEDNDDYEEAFAECTARDNINYLEILHLYRFLDDSNYEDTNLNKSIGKGDR